MLAGGALRPEPLSPDRPPPEPSAATESGPKDMNALALLSPAKELAMSKRRNSAVNNDVLLLLCKGEGGETVASMPVKRAPDLWLD